jgi:N-acetylmuramoyl-L-alanine amidase
MMSATRMRSNGKSKTKCQIAKRAFLVLFGFWSLIFAIPPKAGAQAKLTVVHPLEGQQLPAIREVFVFGEVTPGTTLSINTLPVKVHPKGGYLAMIPVAPGPFTLVCESTAPTGEFLRLERHVSVAPPFTPSPVKPLTLVKESIEPAEDVVLSPGDPLRVTFQGSPQASGEFSIEGVAAHIPAGERLGLTNSTDTSRGLYEGVYVIQPGDKAKNAEIEASLKNDDRHRHFTARGRLTIDSGAVPRVGQITEDIAAVRSGIDGGYDIFLYKGMKVRLTGKARALRRVRLAGDQGGWIKENSIQELPKGTPVPHSVLSNMIMNHREESTVIRVPLEDVLPYRVEQSLDPAQLIVTLYGAVDHTDLIRYDPADALVHQVRWRQIRPDICQIIIDPAIKTWWGYDVRYEDNTLVIEIRKPWPQKTIKGMVIAIDPGHGGPELGATGPHGILEKDVNLGIARVVRDTLESAGVRVIMTRDSDMDVSLYERSRIAWRNRAQLFISIHCNASGEGENPLINSGYSVYWYHPQSMALAKAVHAEYGSHTNLPDRGLFYSDFAVNRMSQMPAILTEQAYIIIPEQEQLLQSPEFRRAVGQSILNGIKAYIQGK